MGRFHHITIQMSGLVYVYSGESGAGKTVSAKHIMTYISKVSGQGSDKVEVSKAHIKYL